MERNRHTRAESQAAGMQIFWYELGSRSEAQAHSTIVSGRRRAAATESHSGFAMQSPTLTEGASCFAAAPARTRTRTPSHASFGITEIILQGLEPSSCSRRSA